MAKRSINPELSHDVANPVAAELCDTLFGLLAERIGPLSRTKQHRWCSLSKRDGNQFAHVTHRKKLQRIEVWFSGDLDLIDKFPELQIRKRKDTPSGWGTFNLRFFLDDDAHLQDAMTVVASRIVEEKETPRPEADFNLFPDEAVEDIAMMEGATSRTLVNKYERSKQLRDRCINHYGASCYICGFNFGDVYGCVVAGFIHVHHLRSLGAVGEEHLVDPVADLCPLCPNCHAVVHSRPGQPPYEIEEVREFLRQRANAQESAKRYMVPS